MNFKLIIIILGLAIYLNSFFNSFVWDDEEQIVNNLAVHSLTNIPSLFSGSTFNTGGSGGLAGMYYKPLMPTFFSILYTFGGGSPFLFHLFQASIHIVNALLIFSLFKIFFKDRLSFFLALIFLVHPLNTESVVYVSALQDTIFLFFGLLALWLFRTKAPGLKSFLLTSLLLLLSLLSKETGFLFIPILFLFNYLYQKQRIVIPTLISVSALGTYLLLRFAVAGVGLQKSGPSPILLATPFERLITTPKIIYTYLADFFFPKDLAIAQHWVIKNISWGEFTLPALLSSLFFLGIFALGFYLWKMKDKNLKTFAFFGLWFILGLGLHLQLFPLDMTFAERWFYFPMIGLLGLLGIIIDKLKLTPKTVTVFAILIVVTLSARTFIRNFDWKNGLTLFSHDSQISQNSFDLENNLGVELFRAGKVEEAAIHFEKSADLAPHWWTSWNNLGVIAERKGNYQKAEEYYRKSIQNGEYFLAYENLANILLVQDKPMEAKVFIKEAVKKLPLNAKLWFTLALSNYKLGDKEGALLAARQAYLLSPTQQSAYVYSRLSQNQPLELK